MEVAFDFEDENLTKIIELVYVKCKMHFHTMLSVTILFIYRKFRLIWNL